MSNNNNNKNHQPEVEETLSINELSNKLIECQTCFRTFHTQAQFGQHSRICRGGATVARRFINISSQPYKYCFLERQNKDKLEIKSRFIVKICNVAINWKDIAKKNGLHDSAIAQLLKSKKLDNVHVAIRHRKESGLIVANFVIRSVQQTPDGIHSAKIRIEEAVDEVKNKLPEQVHMRMHLCQINKCRELVIRDTEGYCSRHRAQKYHKKNAKKRKNATNANNNNNNNNNHNNHNNHMNEHNATTAAATAMINHNMNYMNNNNNNNNYMNHIYMQQHIQQLQLQQLQQLQHLQQQQQQQQQQQHLQHHLQQQQQQMNPHMHMNNFNLRKRRLPSDFLCMEQPKQKIKLCDVNEIQMPLPLPLPLLLSNELEEHSANTEEGKENEREKESIASLIMDPLLEPILFNQLREFFGNNSYMVKTPSSLYGVPINRSPLRRNGMNIISVDYSTSVPNPKQVLQKNGQLVVFGTKKDTQQYLDNIGESQHLVPSSSSNSIRFPQFCRELTQNYMACVPAPDCLIGSTLAQTPQLAQSGINAIAVNLQMQHPSEMCNTPFKPNDVLLCCFNRADNKQEQLLHAFEQIQKIKNTET